MRCGGFLSRLQSFSEQAFYEFGLSLLVFGKS
jgi:hypothetical protein